MYCDKCGGLAHGDRLCHALIQSDPQEITPRQHGPTMVVLSPPARRLEAAGWFSRSFFTTAGVIAAALALPAGCILLLCVALVTSRVATSDNSIQLTIDAKRIAMPTLRQRGIDELSSDSVAWRDGSEVVFSGDGRTSGGTIKPFVIRFRVSTFGRDERWQVKSLMVDGESH